MLAHRGNCGHHVIDKVLLVHVTGDLGISCLQLRSIHLQNRLKIKPSFACSSWAVSLVPTGLGNMLAGEVKSMPAAYCTITRADAPSRRRALASAGLAGNHRMPYTIGLS